MASSAVVTPVIILPGSGCTPTRECNFYAWFGDAIERTRRYEAVMRNMPDPHVCREKKWIPFINEQLGGSNPEAVVVVGRRDARAKKSAHVCGRRGGE